MKVGERRKDERDLRNLELEELGLSGDERVAQLNAEFPDLPPLTRCAVIAQIHRIRDADAKAHGEASFRRRPDNARWS